MHARLKTLAESIFENEDLGVVVTSREGEVCQLNPLAERLLGITLHAAQVVGWAGCLVHNSCQLLASVEQALLLSASQEDIEANVVTSSGHQLLVKARCLYDAGQVIGLIWRFDFTIAGLVEKPPALVRPADEHGLRLKRYQKMFEGTAVAHWAMDIEPLYRLLLRHRLETGEDLKYYLEHNPEFWDQMRDCIRVLEANEAAARLYGAQDVEHWRARVATFFRKRDLLQMAYAALSIGDKPTTVNYQTDILTFDGESKHLWVGTEIPLREDIEFGLFVSALDISMLKAAESELEERQQFLSAVLRTVPDLLFVYDFKRQDRVFENGDISKHLGYSPDMLDAVGPRFISYIIHPDDRITAETFQTMVSTLQAGQIYEDTLRLQHVDGDWRHFYFRTAALEQEGDQVELGVVVARDITEVIRTQQNLLEQERQYRLLADNFTDIIVTTDKALKQEYVSPSLEKVLGYHPDEICGMEHKQFLRLLGLQDIQQELSEDYQNALGKKPHSRDVGGEYLWVLERDVNAKDGRSVPLELKISLLKGVYNELQGIMILCRDISERRRVQADLKLAAKVFENSLEGIYITDAFGKISQVNRSFIQATGYSEEQAIGQRPAFLSSGWHGQYFANEIRPLLQQSGYWEGELINRRASGEVFPAWVGITEVRSQESELLGYITSFRDITETKTNEERIRKLAYFDPLTELPNRSLFHDRLNQSLQRAQRNQSNFALLFLDLDRFKAINDSMGHEVGDQLLREVAQRLQYCIRNDDTVARMGGDEFTIILSALSDRDAAESASVQVSLKIMNALSKPFFLEGCELYISTSIGIALYPFDGEEETALLKNADTAMYHAKDLGKNGYQFYTEAMNSRSLERLEFQNSLHRAVANDEFELVFQPIYNLRDHTLVGIEALLRWQHPGKGEIQPEDFMPVAKETGLIVQIGEWAIRKACKQMATWLSIGCKVERIAVNVSALQFTDGNLIRTIIDAIDESGISPNQLELEVTESVLMEDFGFSQSMLQDLKVLGVRISVDDFGTGSSSLNYLKKLPLDCLKIDQSFVENIHLSADDRRIAQAIIALAKSFNLKVVAEGLEGPLQANCVLDMGCEEGQGFLLGRPQPVRQMTSLLLSLG